MSFNFLLKNLHDLFSSLRCCTRSYSQTGAQFVRLWSNDPIHVADDTLTHSPTPSSTENKMNPTIGAMYHIPEFMYMDQDLKELVRESLPPAGQRARAQLQDDSK